MAKRELISRYQLDQCKKEEKYVLLTAEQVQKDFAMFGMDVQFSGNTRFAYRELYSQLDAYISEMLTRNTEKLMSLLYQIDLSEKEISQSNLDEAFGTISEKITHLILEREMKKVLLRMYFKEKGY